MRYGQYGKGIPVDSKLYETRRNELLGLVNEAISLGLPEPHNGILRCIHRKCQEDQFEIALVGEFQGGKSTTFNALCDGREISPRGLGGGGIKTSAAIVTVQHISDPDESRDGLAEWAEVRWRGKAEIALGFAGLLKARLAEDQAFQDLFMDATEEGRIGHASSPEQVAQLLDLDRDEHRVAAERAVKAEWQRWAGQKQSYTDDDLDQLRIATLQLRFHNTAEWRDLTAKTISSVADFQKLITFPRDWMQRWGNAYNAAFVLNEVAFVFIADSLVRVRAGNLARIGCRITDCPGLFASAWDTDLARQAMSRADAVWYLFNGAKQIGDSDKKVIAFIREHGWTDKLRATVNMRGNTHDHIIDTILPVDEAILGAMGLPDLQLKPYDARLAFLACQGELILTNPSAFGEWDRYCMAFDFDRRIAVANLEPPKAWRRFVQLQAAVAGWPSLEDADTLDARTVHDVRAASRLDEVLGELETMVIQKKAISILVANGCRPAAEALASFEGVLQAREDAASMKESEFRDACTSAQENLSAFLKDADEVIEHQRDDGADTLLAYSLWDAAITSGVESVCVRAGDRIGNEVLTVANLGLLLLPLSAVSKESLANNAAEIVASEFRDVMMAEMTKWFEGLSQGKDQQYQRHVANKARDACERIRRKWDQHVADMQVLTSRSLVTGIRLPEVQGVLARDEARLPDTIRDCVSAELLKQGLTNFNPSAVLTSVVLAITVIILLAMNPVGWWGLVLGLIGAVVAGGAGVGVQGWHQSHINDKITAQLRHSLNAHLVAKRSEIVDQLTGMVRPFRLCYLNYMEEAMRHVQQEFNNRVTQTHETFRRSNADRVRIATEACLLREEKIAPARLRIRAFEATVRQELGLDESAPESPVAAQPPS